MSNILPAPNPSSLPPSTNNNLQIAIGAIVTLATIMGTRFTTGSQVDGVINQASELQTEMVRLSHANQALNLEIKAMAGENKRLNEMAIELGKENEERITQLIKFVEGLKK